MARRATPELGPGGGAHKQSPPLGPRGGPGHKQSPPKLTTSLSPGKRGGATAPRRGARPRLVQTKCWSPRDVGNRALVVYAAYFFSVQYCDLSCLAGGDARCVPGSPWVATVAMAPLARMRSVRLPSGEMSSATRAQPARSGRFVPWVFCLDCLGS